MHTTNIGDGALVRGIQYTLPQDIQTDIRFVDHCITDFLKYDKLKFDDQYVEWLNNNANLLLIGGGGLISEKNYLPTILPPDVIYRLKLPIVVYAVGHNLFDGERLKNPAGLSALIDQIRELGGLFSVRNDGSLDKLKRDIGVSAANPSAKYRILVFSCRLKRCFTRKFVPADGMSCCSSPETNWPIGWANATLKNLRSAGSHFKRKAKKDTKSHRNNATFSGPK